MNKPIFLIAEAGVNHNGSRNLAFELVDAAIEAGVDAVKFQTFKAEHVVTKDASKADYQLQATNADESQYAMLKRLELSHEIHHDLIQYCHNSGIQFLSTAFDLPSLRFLVGQLKLKTLKIPSGEITNGPLLLAHAELGRDMIVSTGMATIDEIEVALGVIAFGLLNGETDLVSPSRVGFERAYRSSLGKEILHEKVTLLHCTTEYPASVDEINLNAIKAMRDKFSLKVGYSDHSVGITVPIAAAALGATVIEKHFTLDKTLDGPDHKASLSPQELLQMVVAVRDVEYAMGSGSKSPQLSELKNRDIARRSLVAAEKIAKGDPLNEENIAIKRPGTGISPMEYWELIGTKSKKNLKIDEAL